MQVQNSKIGVITFWSLCATSLSVLRGGLEKLGLDGFCPEQVTQMGALRAALEKVYPGRLIRKLKKNGFVVVDEEKGDDENEFATLASAKFVYHSDDEKNVMMELSIHAASLSEEDKIRDAFVKTQGLMPAVQMGQILSKLCEHLGGTTLRPSGGVYWLSHKALDTWRTIASVVETAACPPKGVEPSSVYVIKHDMDAEAVRAVRDAIVHEMNQEATRLRREIDSGELGERAMESRRKEIHALLAKVSEYETLLDVGLSTIREVLVSVETTDATAAFKESALSGPITVVA